MSGVNLIRLSHASIDICTRCQLKCVSCSTSKGLIKNGFIQEGYMSFSLFKDILDRNPQIVEIELSNWGEIFLNPDLLKIMKYSFEKKVALSCDNGANFNSVRDDVLEGLVKYQFKCLNLSIDGATQETYVQYRKMGNIDNVFANILKLNYYKKKYHSLYPKLSWQFIIFGHNEHEINQVKGLCRELNMKFNPKLNHSNFSPIVNAERVKTDAEIDCVTRSEYKRKNKTEYKHPCYQCLYSPQINWNGDVLGCCVNKWKGLGNIRQHTIEDIVNSQLYQHMLLVLFGKEDADESIPCFFCPNLQKIKKHPLNEEGLKKYSNYVPIALR